MSDTAPKDTAPDAQAIHSLRIQLVAAERHLKDGLNTVSTALQLLETWEGKALNFPDATTPNERAVAINRARCGRCRAFKIETDPELETFIRARISRLTYGQITATWVRSFRRRLTPLRLPNDLGIRQHPEALTEVS